MVWYVNHTYSKLFKFLLFKTRTIALCPSRSFMIFYKNKIESGRLVKKKINTFQLGKMRLKVIFYHQFQAVLRI